MLKFQLATFLFVAFNGAGIAQAQQFDVYETHYSSRKLLTPRYLFLHKFEGTFKSETFVLNSEHDTAFWEITHRNVYGEDSMKITFSASYPAILDTAFYIYDQNGCLTLEGGRFHTTVYHYHNGMVSGNRRQTPSADSIAFFYQNNLLVKTEHFRHNDTTDVKYYFYNKNKQLITEHTYYAGRLIKLEKFRYNKNGQIIQKRFRVRRSGRDSRRREVFQFGSDRRIRKYVKILNGGKSRKHRQKQVIRYFYNTNNIKVKEVEWEDYLPHISLDGKRVHFKTIREFVYY